MNAFRAAHVAWAWVVIFGNALAGIWSLAAWRIHGLRTRALWWFTVAMESAMVVQVVLGVATMQALKLEADALKFHMFYGFVAMIFIALLYSYRETIKARIYMWYGFFGLFLMGLGIRAMLKA